MNAIIELYQAVTPVLFFLSFFGNILGYVVMLRRKMIKIGARSIYRYLFITDSLFISQIVVDALFTQFSYDITKLSIYTCNTYYYFSYTLASISPMLLVYIAMERYVSIKYPARRLFLRKTQNQFKYLLIVIAYNMLFYFPLLFAFEIRSTYTTGSTECHFVDSLHELILSLMDLINRVLVPCVLITLSTCMLLHCIFKSRHRVLKNYTIAENRNFKKDIKLTFTSVCLNVIYVLLVVPLPIFLLVNGAKESKTVSDACFYIFFILFYVSFGVNFYVILVSNSLFRSQFINLFKLQSPNNKLVKIQNI